MTDASETKSPAEFYEAFFVPAMFAPLADIVVGRAGIEPGQRVLDVACGTGVVARRAAARAGAGGQVTGLDLREGMIARARSLPAPDGAAIEWRLGDAAALDLPDAAFDRVICQQGLQFFPDRPRALAEMHRVLKPGGRLVLAVWLGYEQQGIIADLTEAEIRHLARVGVPQEEVVAAFSLGDRDELARLVAGAGFPGAEIEEVEITADFPDPDRFVANVEAAYAAVVPETMGEIGGMDRLVEAIQTDIAGAIAAHTVGDRLRFPMRSHLVVAERG
jgi:SAM-dependent methyltransferase